MSVPCRLVSPLDPRLMACFEVLVSCHCTGKFACRVEMDGVWPLRSLVRLLVVNEFSRQIVNDTFR